MKQEPGRQRHPLHPARRLQQNEESQNTVSSVLSFFPLALSHVNDVILKLVHSPFCCPSVLSLIHSDSFLCDCQLQWLPNWLTSRALQAGVSATCAHPESLKGTSIFQAPPNSFVCGQLCNECFVLKLLPFVSLRPITVLTSAAPPQTTFQSLRLPCSQKPP